MRQPFPNNEVDLEKTLEVMLNTKFKLTVELSMHNSTYLVLYRLRIRDEVHVQLFLFPG